MRNHFNKTSANKVRNTFALGLGIRLLIAFLAISLITSTFSAATPANAAILRKLPFSASLKTAAGVTVSDGNYSLTFSIYTAATGGTALWTETQSVAVVNGVVSANLGESTALPASLTFNDGAYYLGVQVGSDAEMSPRRLIGAVPISLNADTVDGAHAGTAADEVLLLDSSGNIDIDGNIVTAGTLQGGTVTTSTLTTASGNLTVAPVGGTTAITGAVTVSGIATLTATGGNALALTGAPAANGTASLLQLGTAISGGSANGTFIGINAASGFTGNFVDFQVANDTKFKVTAAGIQVGGSILPSTGGTYDLGSPTNYFANAYIDNLHVESSSTSGTSGSSFTINDDSTGDEDSSILFYRGGSLASAQLLWRAGTGSNGLATGSGAFSLNNPAWILNSTPTDADYGKLSLGTNAAAFDGTSTGHFVGSASGTEIAVNAASGFAGNLVDLQVQGSSKLSVNSTGALVSASSLTGTILNATSELQIQGTSINTAGALTNVAYLNQANTFTAGNTISVAGAASTPALSLSGTWYTGGSATTTKPQLLVQPNGATSTAWSTAGTGLGVNSASGFTGNLIDVQSNGTSRFRVDYQGNAVATGTIYSAALWTGNSNILSGNNNAAIGFGNYIYSSYAAGVGQENFIGTNNGSSVVMGYANRIADNASGGFALGNLLAPSNGSILLGSGINSSNRLTLSTASSLGIGFNSTVPTFIVTAASGAGTYGNVGIGTGGPDRRLDVADSSNPQLRLTYTDGTTYTDFQTNSSGQLALQPTAGISLFNTAGVNNSIRIFGSGGSNYTQLTHDNTNAILSSSSGELQLQGAGTNQFIVGDIGTAVNLVFEESSTISGQGGNTVSLGQSGDTFNLAVTGVTYNVGTLTATSGVTIQGQTSTTSTVLTANGPTSLSGNLMDLQVNGSSKLSVNASGALTAVGVTSSGVATFSTTGSNAVAITGTPASSATSSLLQLGANAIASGSASGTFIGINPSSFSGNFLDFQVAGTSVYKVSSAGSVTQGGAGFAITSTNTTGTGTSASVSVVANSLTTGNALSVSSSSLTSGTLANFAVTGTGATGDSDTHKVINISTSGTNATANESTYGLYVSNTRAGTGSTNYGIYSTVSGGTTNYSGYFQGAPIRITQAAQANVTIGTLGTNWGGFSYADTLTSTNFAIGGFATGGSSYTQINKYGSSGAIAFQDSNVDILRLSGDSTTATLLATGNGSGGALNFQAFGALSISTTANNSNISITPNGSGDIRIVTSGNAGSNLFIGDGGTTNYAKFDTNGALTFTGAARPYNELTLTTNEAIVPSAAFCARNQVDSTVSYKVLDCDDSTDESTFWQFKMPTNYANGTNVQVDVYWSSAAATSGAAVIGAQYAAVASGSEFDAPTLSTIASATTTTDSSANDVNTTTITLSSPSINADDLVSLKITRDADNGSDTLVGDARVLKARVRFLVGS